MSGAATRDAGPQDHLAMLSGRECTEPKFIEGSLIIRKISGLTKIGPVQEALLRGPRPTVR